MDGPGMVPTERPFVQHVCHSAIQTGDMLHSWTIQVWLGEGFGHQRLFWYGVMPDCSRVLLGESRYTSFFST